MTGIGAFVATGTRMKDGTYLVAVTDTTTMVMVFAHLPDYESYLMFQQSTFMEEDGSDSHEPDDGQGNAEAQQRS